jgi:hypothetical protein
MLLAACEWLLIQDIFIMIELFLNLSHDGISVPRGLGIMVEDVT